MTAALETYLGLESELARLRWLHAGFESAEEDALLDRMDVAWDALTEDDVRELEKRPPAPQLTSPVFRHRTGQIAHVDRDVFAESSVPRRLAEVA